MHGNDADSSKLVKRKIEFYGDDEYQKISQHNQEDQWEAEVVFKRDSPPDEQLEKDLKTQRQLVAKQNKSTSAALFKNHFLSSASEDDEGEEADGQRGNQRLSKLMKVKLRERVKGVPGTAAMHSSLNNGKRSNLPLYGQRATLQH